MMIRSLSSYLNLPTTVPVGDGDGDGDGDGQKKASLAFCGDFWKSKQIATDTETGIAQNSPLVYTCDKRCIEEGDKNRIKKRMHR